MRRYLKDSKIKITTVLLTVSIFTLLALHLIMTVINIDRVGEVLFSLIYILIFGLISISTFLFLLLIFFIFRKQSVDRRQLGNK